MKKKENSLTYLTMISVDINLSYASTTNPRTNHVCEASSEQNSFQSDDWSLWFDFRLL